MLGSSSPVLRAVDDKHIFGVGGGLDVSVGCEMWSLTRTVSEAFRQLCLEGVTLSLLRLFPHNAFFFVMWEVCSWDSDI